LLIHNNSDIFSEQSSNEKEIRDKDIPLEKRNLINNREYFKQLSLSFYGESQSPRRQVMKTENDQHSFRKTGSKMNTSLSPRSQQDYYYGMRKSPNLQYEKDPFQMTLSHLVQLGQKSQASLTSSKLNLSQRDKIDKHEAKSPKSIARIDLKDLKGYKVKTNNVLTARAKNDAKGMYAQFTTGQTTCTTSTPRYSNFWDNDILKEAHSPGVKKGLNTKVKATNKEYLLTEPNSSLLKNTNSPRAVPKKLNMYALDNLSILNFKVIMGADGKIQSNKAANEKVPVKPSLGKGLQGTNVKRSGVGINRQTSKKISYFD